MEQLMAMMPNMPGVNAGKMRDAQIDEKAIGKIEAIILSMTPRERTNPDLLNASRKKRIAAGSGTSVEDINSLLRQFEQVKQLMKKLSGSKRFGGFGGMGGMGGLGTGKSRSATKPKKKPKKKR